MFEPPYSTSGGLGAAKREVRVRPTLTVTRIHLEPRQEVPMKKFLFCSALFAAIVATASAQTQFVAVIEAGQEVPPTPSTQTGLGSFTLDPFTKVLSYNITITGLTGSFAGAHIHQGAVGANGGILFNLSGGPTTYVGSTVALNPAQENLLKTNGLYVNFHSSSFGGGEIRGQINAAQDQFMVAMTAAKEVPPSGTGATGSGTLTLNASNQIVYDINFSGISGAFSAAHIHDGATGVNGGVVFPLTLAGPGHLQGTTAALSATQRAKFRAGLLYVNVHSAGFPNGEIRGQTTSAFLNYGTGCPHAGGVATLAGGGVPTQGGTVTIAINNAPSAGSFGILFVSIASFNGSIGFGCPLYVNPAVLIPITLPLPGSSISFPSVLPTPITSGTAVNIQYVGDKGGGVPYDTNGLQMLITN